MPMRCDPARMLTSRGLIPTPCWFNGRGTGALMILPGGSLPWARRRYWPRAGSSPTLGGGLGAALGRASMVDLTIVGYLFP